MAHLLEAFESPPMAPPPSDSPSPSLLDRCPSSSQEQHDGNEQTTAMRPLSGPGSARHTRRLQLRNANFRAATIPPRKVTPKSLPSSAERSSKAGSGSLSDIENISPATSRPASQKRRSSGVFHELDNLTITRPKKQRQGTMPGRHSARPSSDYDAASADWPNSPPSHKSTIRARAVKTRARVPQRRRSGSGETSKYIDHLETELAEAQTLITSMASSASAAANPSKLRALAMEIERQQEELNAWEEMYDQRVQEEADKHYVVEASLRQQVKSLQQEADDLKIRLSEAESETEAATANLQSVDAANAKLEKRVEMMSDLLAASKVDLYASTPGHGRRSSRPRSMLLPRFPTANALACSPERQTPTQPPSPRLAFARSTDAVFMSSRHTHSSSDTSPRAAHSTSEFMSDVESIFSEAQTAGDSMTSVDNTDGVLSLSAWGLPVMRPQRAKPARRMRRFGAGSLGPKPLILPTTNQTGQCSPGSAPPFVRRETSPIVLHTPVQRCIEASSSRKRSSTVANAITFANLAASPIVTGQTRQMYDSDSEEAEQRGSAESKASHATNHSMNAIQGYNLMAELGAVNTRESNSSDDIDEVLSEDERSPLAQPNFFSTPERGAQDGLECDGSTAVKSCADAIETGGPGGDTVGVPNDTADSEPSKAAVPYRNLFERLRLLFGDLLQSPVAMARHVVQTAQTRIRIPAPLQNVQWWLVGLLLGPMMKRRMLEHARACPPLPPDPGPPPLHVDPAFLSRSCPPSYDASDQWSRMHRASHAGRDDGRTGKNRKRTEHPPQCSCRQERSRHSPWLWLKFSLTLAFAIGVAFIEGPGSLLRQSMCACRARRIGEGTVAGRKAVKAE